MVGVLQSVGVDVYNQEITGEVAAALTAACGGTNTSGAKVIAINGEIAGTLDANYYKGCGERQGVEREVVLGTYQTVTGSLMASGTNQVPAVYDAWGNGDGKTVCTITGDHQNRVTDYTALCVGNGQLNQMSDTYQPVTGPLMASGYSKLGTQEAANDMYIVQAWDGSQVSPTLTANNAGGSQRMPDKANFNAVLQYAPDVSHGLKAKANCQFREDSETYVAAVDCRNGTENPDINGTLQAKSTGGTGTNFNNVCRTNAIVRRLTPLECERLQGYPDGWTDIGEWVDSKGKKHKDADSPRYKALGNSIALPFWQWMARRICAQYERTVTMASLFDGIGGFPLVFQRCGAVPVWASEIEEFCVAVTRERFGEN
jgi:hypothetical protein